MSHYGLPKCFVAKIATTVAFYARLARLATT
jgi:hypothetical protein